MTRSRGVGLLASVTVVIAAVFAWRSSADTGYVEIKTVPVAAFTQTALYLDSTRLDPIRQGTALLRQRVGTLSLSGESYGMRAWICDVVVKRDRITSVTISVLERPPRCVCKFTGSGDPNDHTCVS
jgi:hypothetical protein